MVPLELVRGVLLVLLLPTALWHGLQATPHHVSGVLFLPLRGRVEATSEPSCPQQCAERLQPVSHVFNIAATQSPLAPTVALPGCCKVTSFPLEPHSLSLF